MARIIRLNTRRPNPLAVKRIGALIRKGGVIAFPTETVYGLGGNVFSKDAARKIFAIKERSEQKPLLVLISDSRDLESVARHIPESAKKLMTAFWPGPLTLIFKKRARVPHEVSGGTDSIAVRFSPHPVALALLRAAGVPITATSANRSGKPNYRNAQGVYRALGKKKELDAVIDGGRTPIGIPSTIVDVSSKHPRIIREGTIRRAAIRRVLAE